MKPNIEMRNVYGMWRLAHNLTLREIAEILGVSEMSVSLFERDLMTSKKMKENYDKLIIRKAVEKQ